MYEKIVNEVVDEVMRRMKQPTSFECIKPLCLLLGTSTPMIESSFLNSYEVTRVSNDTVIPSFELNTLVSRASCIILTEMSVSNLAHVAVGAFNTPVEEAIIDSLLLGKEIILLEEALLYRNYKNTASKTFYRRLMEYEETIISYGIRIQSSTKLSLQTKQDTLLPGGNNAVQEQRKVLNKRLILEKDLIDMGQSHPPMLQIPKDSIITPMALDYARAHHIELIKG